MFKGTSVATPRQDLAGVMSQTLLSQDKYVFPFLFPIVPVGEKTGIVYKKNLARMLAPRDVRREPGSGYSRSRSELENGTYACKEYGHEKPIDDSLRAQYASAFDLEVWETEQAMHDIWLPQEIRVAAICNNNTNFPNSGNTGKAVSNPWSGSSGTPIDDMNSARAGCRARGAPDPNVLVISEKTYNNLGNCDQIVNRIKYQSGLVVNGRLPLAALAAAFDVQRVLVAKARKNTASDGLTASLSTVWTETEAFAAYVDPSNIMQAPTLGKTFVWGGDGGELVVETYREEGIRGDIVRVRQHTDENLILSACGYRFTAVAS